MEINDLCYVMQRVKGGFLAWVRTATVLDDKRRQRIPQTALKKQYNRNFSPLEKLSTEGLCIGYLCTVTLAWQVTYTTIESKKSGG